MNQHGTGGDHESINDYILTKGIAASEFRTLKGEEDSCSDHYFVSFEVDYEATPSDPIFRTDPELLSAAIRKAVIATPVLHTKAEVDGFVANLSSTLQGCIDTASKQIGTRHSKLPWWTPGLTKLKNLLRTISRRIKRLSSVESLEGRVYTVIRHIVRNKYKKEMNRCRYAAFWDLCTQKKPWGGGL